MSESITKTHIRWLELELQDAIALVRAVRDGTHDPGDLDDFLESTRGFHVGESWGYCGKAVCAQLRGHDGPCSA